ncbi:MAG: hypothetical protein QE284_12880 [Rhizobium sp.]|nr:hypothetical protein [Rhizobium sp.]
MPRNDVDKVRHRPIRSVPLLAVAMLVYSTGVVVGSHVALAQTQMVAPASPVEPQLPPSRETTSSIGSMTVPKTATPSALPTAERRTLIVLLALCFGVMAFAGGRLLRRGFMDVLGVDGKRDRRTGPPSPPPPPNG